MTAAVPPLPAEATHVLVVDDDSRLRDLLVRFLNSEGVRVTAVGTTAEAQACLAVLVFDALVLDVMLPGEDGLSLLEDLRRRDIGPVLLLTARDAPDDRVDGLARGADDYLTKPFDPRELVLRLGNLRRRVPAPGPAPVRLGSVVWYPDRQELRHGDAPVHLTTAESRLLALLAAQPGTVLAREALACETGTGQRTLDVQVTRLRRKIEHDPRQPRYLVTVRGHGYVLRPD